METSHFEELSGELRNHIYEYVFTRDRPIELDFRIQDGRPSISMSDIEGNKNFLALTATCRHIRQESLLVALHSNAYRVSTKGIFQSSDSENPVLSGTNFAECLQALESAIPRSANCFNDLTIDLGPWPDVPRQPAAKIFVDIVRGYRKMSPKFGCTSIIARFHLTGSLKRPTLAFELKRGDTRQSATERLLEEVRSVHGERRLEKRRWEYEALMYEIFT